MIQRHESTGKYAKWRNYLIQWTLPSRTMTFNPNTEPQDNTLFLVVWCSPIHRSYCKSDLKEVRHVQDTVSRSAYIQ